MKTMILKILVCCLLASVSASAQTMTYNMDNAPVFSFDVPEGWKFESKPSQRDPTVRRISGTASTGLLWFGVWVVKDAKTLDEAIAYVRSTAKSLISDGKETKPPYDGEVNGMKARHLNVTGTMKQDGKNEKFDARVVVFETGSGRVGIAVCMADPEGLTSQKAQIDTFFRSLKPAR